MGLSLPHALTREIKIASLILASETLNVIMIISVSIFALCLIRSKMLLAMIVESDKISTIIKMDKRWRVVSRIFNHRTTPVLRIKIMGDISVGGKDWSKQSNLLCGIRSSP